jgi:hypothetical protein
MRERWSIFVAASLLQCVAWASDSVPDEAEQGVPTPWFTGPLIAPTGTAIPYGHFEIEPYIYYTVNTGTYDRHWNAHSDTNFYSFNPLIYATFGLTPWMDIYTIPEFFWNRTKNQGFAGFGDLPLGFDFQVYPADASSFPGIKFSVTEQFPTGKYQRLNPHKLETDAIGSGSFETSLGLELYRIYHLAGIHYMTLTFLLQYTINSAVEVHGFNTYGGGHGTHGCVIPGEQLQGIFSFEVNFTQNWGFAMDTVYTHQSRTIFFGHRGRDASGNPATVGKHSSEQLNFAPAIEYSFSEKMGLIAGVYLSAAGRNSTRFRSGVIAFDYYY